MRTNAQPMSSHTVRAGRVVYTATVVGHLKGTPDDPEPHLVKGIGEVTVERASKRAESALTAQPDDFSLVAWLDSLIQG